MVHNILESKPHGFPGRTDPANISVRGIENILGKVKHITCMYSDVKNI